MTRATPSIHQNETGSFPSRTPTEQTGKLGGRSVIQWCKNHPWTTAALVLTILVAITVFAAAPYLAVILAGLFGTSIIIPSSTLIAAGGGILGAAISSSLALKIISSTEPLKEEHKKTIDESVIIEITCETNSVDKEICNTEKQLGTSEIKSATTSGLASEIIPSIKTLKEEHKKIMSGAAIKEMEIAHKISSLDGKIRNTEDQLDSYSEIEKEWLQLEQTEVNKINETINNPPQNLCETQNSNYELLYQAFDKKMEDFQISQDSGKQKIAELWKQRLALKSEYEKLENELKDARLEKIEKLKSLRPLCTSEQLDKLNWQIILLEKPQQKTKALTRAQRRAMFG